MARWGMVIDLSKCIGCETCRFVCNDLNRPPGGEGWRRVIDPGPGADPDQLRIFLPIGCMQCEKPPCLSVCPSGATHRSGCGTVDVDFGTCIGCGACIVACPYSARSLADQDYLRLEADENEASEMDRIGVSSKCHFCRPVVEKGRALGLTPGVDPEASPYCVRYCLGEALHFGDLDDDASEVSRLIRQNRTIRLHADLGTEPSVFYLVGERGGVDVRKD